MRTIALLLPLTLLGLPVRGDDPFIDHGVATHAVESRGATVVHSGGRNLVICLNNDRSERGWMLVTDIDTGQSEQVHFPEGIGPILSMGAPFASYVSTRGRFYTGTGGTLLEFEPATMEWLYHGRPHPQAQAFIDYAFAEDAQGRIYAGTHPGCHLIRYDPQTRTSEDLGQLDPQEHYVSWLALDDAGWLYCGIGTARGNIVAYNTNTGEKRQIPDEAERTARGGWVFPSVDGKVYGTVAGKNWRLHNGVGEVIEPAQRGRERLTGVIGWKSRTGTFPDGRKLVYANLEDGWIDIEDPATGETKRIEFTYEAVGGMGFTSLAEGPDGKVYGSTCHPMRFVRFDPDTETMEDFGGVKDVGNFCAMAKSGDLLAAVSYSYGILHLYDPARPFTGGEGDAPNPWELGRWPQEVCRPRVCVAHPDGRHLLMAGYAAYGLAGGGLVIHDLQTGASELITHEHLIPSESTVTMTVLPDGDIVGGTDISAPGGGHPQSTEATLYIFDFAKREVAFRTNPVPGATFIRALTTGSDGRVYGVTRNAVFFVFDPRSREVVRTEDWSRFEQGADVVAGPDGMIYVLLDKAIVRVDPVTLTYDEPVAPPSRISYGGPVIDGRLYYSSDANLWSYRLGE